MLQVKAGKIRKKKESDKAPHLWPPLMVIVSRGFARTDNKADIKLPVLPYPLISMCSPASALYCLINFLYPPLK